MNAPRTSERPPLPAGAVLAWRGLTAIVLVLTLFLLLRRSTFPEVFGRYSWPLLAAGLAGVLVSAVLVSARRTGLLHLAYAARGTIAAVTTSIVIALVLLEIAVRVFDPLGASYFEATRRYELDKVPDPLLVYRHPPLRTFEYQGVEVRFNELGLRDRPPRPRHAVKHRVLFLGDSVVFGWGVPEPETVSTRLERLLTEKAGGEVGVVNTGVGSYNTVVQERFLLNHGFDLQPDVVVLLYVTNDVQVHTPPFDPWTRVSLAGKPPLTALDLLTRKSWLVRLFHHVRNGGRLGPRLGGPGSEGWNASMQALRRIQQACDERGIPFVPIFFRWSENADQRLLQDVSAALHPLTVYDTAPWFEGHTIDELVNSKIDSHPNGRAHGIMADSIDDILVDVLPEPGDGRGSPRDESADSRRANGDGDRTRVHDQVGATGRRQDKGSRDS
jgi:hypothetical protein